MYWKMTDLISMVTSSLINQPWSLSNNYDLIRVMGKGAFGEVFEADNKTLKKRVAIKCMKFQFESSLDALRLSRELKILMNSSHPNIVKLYEVVLPNTSASTSNFSLNFKGGHIHNIIDQLCEIHLVMEFVETDLYRIIGSDQYISEGHVKYFLKQIVLATAYLHNSGVIHRDIKPANILVNEDCSLKLCDFGLSRHTESMENRPSLLLASHHSPPRPILRRGMTQHVVTRWYRAPELILLENYSFPVDLWSIGCVFAELLGMMKENVLNFRDRTPIFPGKTCYPLSDNCSSHTEEFDQLSVILDVIGTPSEEETLCFKNSRLKAFLNSRKKKSGQKFQDIFPGSSDVALDLLAKLLSFDPSRRITASEALCHPFLKDFHISDSCNVENIGCDWNESSDLHEILKNIHSDVLEFNSNLLSF